MKNLKHSKLRNSYLIFEALCRFAMDEIAINESTKSVHLITKYFNEKTPLGKELSLYEALGNFTKAGSPLGDSNARELIEITIKLRNEMNNDSLKKAKYRLISEVNDIYGKGRFSENLGQRTKTYKVAASIYKLFEYSTDSNPRDLLRCKETLRESLTGSINDISITNSATSDLDNVTQSKVVDIMYEKFEAKYSNLNETQKKLLANIASGSLNDGYLAEIVTKIESIISSELHKGAIDKEFSITAINEIRSIDVTSPDVDKLQLLVMLLGG